MDEVLRSPVISPFPEFSPSEHRFLANNLSFYLDCPERKFSLTIMLGRTVSILAFLAAIGGMTFIPVLLGGLVLDWSLATVFTGILICGLSVSVLALCILADSRYQFTERALEISNSGVRRCILLQSVIRVDHVRRRVRGAVKENVRIVYRQGPYERSVAVSPENSALFVHDVISRCPHLTGFNQSKLPHLGQSGSISRDHR